VRQHADDGARPRARGRPAQAPTRSAAPGRPCRQDVNAARFHRRHPEAVAAAVPDRKDLPGTGSRTSRPCGGVGP
jgi:hypothetical protein